MEQQEKTKYLIKNNLNFIEWYNTKLQDDDYQPLLDLEEIQGLINKIVAWYELKYSNDETKQPKPLEYYSIDKLEQILTIKEIKALQCNYRWNQLYYNESTNEHYICLYLPEKDNDSNKVVIYANSLGIVESHNVYGLENIIKKKKLTTLMSIYGRIQKSKCNQFDISELEKCININKTDKELRGNIIIFSILTLLYNEDTQLEKAYYRAKSLLEEFNDYYYLNLEIDNLLAIISKLPVIKMQNSIIVEKITTNNTTTSTSFFEKLKYLFNKKEEEQIDLKTLYQNYLNEFKQTGIKPYPDRLLALLLLPEKDKYEPLKVSEGEFYRFYQQEIDEKINQVINDFQITKEDIINFIEAKGIFSCEENYESDKIWFVFSEGFGVMHGAIVYRPELSPEQIYKESISCFHEERFPQQDSEEKNKKRKIAKKLSNR